MRGAALLLMALWLSACAPVPTPTTSPMLYDARDWARAERALIAIPGALTSVKVMEPAERLVDTGGVVAFYRLPGYDGRAEDEFINLDFAARHIADAVIAAGFSQVDFIGHSTGAVIAMEAAKEIRRRAPDTALSVSAISTALPAPQPALAGLRGALGTVAAVGRTGSLDPRTVWLDYYRRLAYGPEVDAAPQTAAAADTLVAANEGRIALPREGLARRHTRDLRRWTNRDAAALEGVEITLYHGAVDPVFPPRTVARFARRLPDAEVVLIEGHGHLLMLTYPQIWDDIAGRRD